jgi:predicted GIY-YIG superfamily endonuclease
MSYAYVIYNNDHDVFYPGFSSNLKKRIARHNPTTSKGWTKRYKMAHDAKFTIFRF